MGKSNATVFTENRGGLQFLEAVSETLPLTIKDHKKQKRKKHLTLWGSGILVAQNKIVP